jgi:hypothetical protein
MASINAQMPRCLLGQMIERHHHHHYPLLLLSMRLNSEIADKSRKTIEDRHANFFCIQIYLLQKLELFRVLSGLRRDHKE